MSTKNVSAAEALTKLKEGNKRFVSGNLEHPNLDIPRRESLTTGQAPYAIVLSCADSRVVPEYIFDQGLGDIFTILVAGNVASQSVTASIEYAVAHLGVQLVVVMGHESCGAVGAAIAGGDNGPSLNNLVGHIAPAVKLAAEQGKMAVNDVVKENAKLGVKELRERSTILTKAADNGVEILPAYYALGSGEVSFLD